MPEQTQEPVNALLSEFNTKLRDIEEKQRLIKDRALLIGENLISIKGETTEEISDLKNKTENLEQEIKKIKLTMQRILEMNNNFARKSELETVKNQLDMFSPLKFARIQDIEKIVKKIIKKDK